ncbi:MAG: hypothetical protein ACOVS5_02075, partial [Oligoflexus sp.]
RTPNPLHLEYPENERPPDTARENRRAIARNPPPGWDSYTAAGAGGEGSSITNGDTEGGGGGGEVSHCGSGSTHLL